MRIRQFITLSVPLSSFSPHSPQTRIITALFTDILILGAVVFLIVASLVLYSLVRYRGRGGDAEPAQKFGSRPLEITWTVIPLLIVIAIFVVTVRAMALIDAPAQPDSAPDLIVTGHQWWWDARYPNGAIAVVAGRQFLGAGISRNTPANLALWSSKPQSIKPGNRMPDQELSTADIDALAAYLGSLQ